MSIINDFRQNLDQRPVAACFVYSAAISASVFVILSLAVIVSSYTMAAVARVSIGVFLGCAIVAIPLRIYQDRKDQEPK